MCGKHSIQRYWWPISDQADFGACVTVVGTDPSNCSVCVGWMYFSKVFRICQIATTSTDVLHLLRTTMEALVGELGLSLGNCVPHGMDIVISCLEEMKLVSVSGLSRLACVDIHHFSRISVSSS